MTAIERWIRRFDAAAAEGAMIQGPDPSVSDLRLAADCIAFVREMAVAFGPGADPPAQPRHTWVIGHSWCHHLDAFAARIKEAS